MPIFKEYASYYDLIYKHKPYDKEAEFVYKWAKKPKTILDLACGTGKHIYQLAPKVEQIIGIDASLEMLTWAYMRTKKFDNVRYIFNKTDKKLLDLPKVDCVMSFFNAVGYIGLEKCLKYIPLKNKGYFIFDIWNKKKVDKEKFTLTRKELQDKSRTIIPERKGNKVILSVLIRTDEDVTIVNEKHIIYLYSETDIEKSCGKAFKIVDKKETDTWAVSYKLEKNG